MDAARRAELIEKGKAILARREAEADQADREAARTVKLTLNQAYLLSQAAAKGGVYHSVYGDRTASADRAAFRRMEKRGLVSESLSAGIGTYHYTLTPLGRYVVEAQGLGS